MRLKERAHKKPKNENETEISIPRVFYFPESQDISYTFVGCRLLYLEAPEFNIKAPGSWSWLRTRQYGLKKVARYLFSGIQPKVTMWIF